MNDYTDAIDAARDGWGAPHSLSWEAVAADFLPYGRGVRLCGWVARETAGAVATFKLWDSNTQGQGQIIAPVNLAANGNDHEWLGDNGVLCTNGIFVDRVAGSFDLTLWVRDWMGS